MPKVDGLLKLELVWPVEAPGTLIGANPCDDAAVEMGTEEASGMTAVLSGAVKPGISLDD